MARIKATTANEKFISLQSEMKEEGDNNFCAVVAVAALTGKSGKEVSAYMIEKGRRTTGKGVHNSEILDTLREFGMTIEPVAIGPIIGQYPGVHKGLKSITTHHMDRFPAVWKEGDLADDKFIAFTPGHCLAIIDGENIDWTKGHAKRINSLYRVSTEAPEETGDHGLSTRSLRLFKQIAKDTGNWNGTVCWGANIEDSKQNNRYLAKIEAAGYVTTSHDDDQTWVSLTDAGADLATSLNIEFTR